MSLTTSSAKLFWLFQIKSFIYHLYLYKFQTFINFYKPIGWDYGCNCVESINQFRDNRHLKYTESLIHEHDIALHLFRSSIISFSGVSQFSVYKSYDIKFFEALQIVMICSQCCRSLVIVLKIVPSSHKSQVICLCAAPLGIRKWSLP